MQTYAFQLSSKYTQSDITDFIISDTQSDITEITDITIKSTFSKIFSSNFFAGKSSNVFRRDASFF